MLLHQLLLLLLEGLVLLHQLLLLLLEGVVLLHQLLLLLLEGVELLHQLLLLLLLEGVVAVVRLEEQEGLAVGEPVVDVL